MFCYIYLCSL